MDMVALTSSELLKYSNRSAVTVASWNSSPSPPIDNIGAMMFVWRKDGRLSELCVLKLCTVISTLI